MRDSRFPRAYFPTARGMENWLIALIWVLVIAFVAAGALRGFRRGPGRSKPELPAPPTTHPPQGRRDQPELLIDHQPD